MISFRQWLVVAAALTVHLASVACRRAVTFPTLGQAVSSPVDVKVSDDGEHFFVLNTDFDRTYNQGSLLVLDKDGNKIKAIPVPRMGRSLTVAGNDLIATVDWQDDTGKNPPHALLFDITDATNPVLKQDFILDCSPINGVLRKGYDYFAISCMEGTLYVGHLNPDRSQSVLKKVRQWGVPRRALYIDPKRELLLGFTTDPGRQGLADEERIDVESYTVEHTPTLIPATDKDGKPVIDVLGNPVSVPNDVPDDWENSGRVQANTSQRAYYQYFVYDLKAESNAAPGCVPSATENCAYPLRDSTDPVVLGELRWIYFKLNNFDGAPDRSPNFNNPQFKFYRTNFYEARPDPDDADTFYLSQRGSPDKSQFANQIVKVSITGDLHATSTSTPVTGGTNVTWTPPLTSNVLNFSRVYGFKGPESVKYVYPGDFQVARIQGQKIVVVNNFRDLVNWVKNDRYFSLGAQTLDDTNWFTELVGDTSAKNLESYYQIAINADGRAATCSFYGNAVLLLDVAPGVDIKKVNRIQ